MAFEKTATMASIIISVLKKTATGTALGYGRLDDNHLDDRNNRVEFTVNHLKAGVNHVRSGVDYFRDGIDYW